MTPAGADLISYCITSFGEDLLIVSEGSDSAAEIDMHVLFELSVATVADYEQVLTYLRHVLTDTHYFNDN